MITAADIKQESDVFSGLLSLFVWGAFEERYGTKRLFDGGV